MSTAAATTARAAAVEDLRAIAARLETLPPAEACERLVHLADALEELRRRAALVLPDLATPERRL